MGQSERLTSIESIKDRLDYDPDTGFLWWKPCSDMPTHWNTRYAGKRAFTSQDGKGYCQGQIFNRLFKAHRVIFAISHGRWPLAVDHINGNRMDNRIANLREVDPLENARNLGIRPANRSGVNGVYWEERRSKWLASIRVIGRSKHLGYFSDFDDAVEARKKADLEYGFHQNHGARHGLSDLLKEIGE